MKFAIFLPALLLLAFCFAQNTTLQENCTFGENATNASECENITIMPLPEYAPPKPAYAPEGGASAQGGVEDAFLVVPGQIPSDYPETLQAIPALNEGGSPDESASQTGENFGEDSFQTQIASDAMQKDEPAPPQNPPAAIPAHEQSFENLALAQKGAESPAQENLLGEFLQKNPQEMAFFALGALSIIALAIFAFYFRHPSPPPYPQELSIGETQMQIINELSEVEKIPTDISRSVQKSKSTVVEHLDSLCKMGLVERIALPSKKFVYYRLTREGRLLLLKRQRAA
ncbi:hypothetical protein COU37_00725 [Candidatus Micrarchaeota archaeon CG10_big_fil_rev_8_21_14_0_10_45_29]|nr:MAG: hypothetical protein COU37_00725 [Candidatus Micrarchaeota archaeon CG10_big_fil_rev_8_21_14_0_10_45_29]